MKYFNKEWYELMQKQFMTDGITEILDKDYSNKEIEELYLNENKHWCETIDSLRKENEKLKKAIEIIKNYYKFKLFPPAMDNIPEISISTDWEHYISQQEYELLKDILGD